MPRWALPAASVAALPVPASARCSAASAPGRVALIGAGVGGIGGVLAGGAAVAGAGSLGVIEADTSGDREITADVAQRIMQSTSQNSSAVRSIWSSVVVEDVEGEDETLETTNVTNYNHMHALTVQFYEILQRYEVEIGLDRLEPLLFLPIGVFAFDKAEVEALWPFIRLLLEDQEQRQLIDEHLGLAAVALVSETVEIPPDPGDPPPPPQVVTVKALNKGNCSRGWHKLTLGPAA